MSKQDLVGLLSQADKSRGFPAGTMAALMQQEIGGNSKYLDDPSAYHYPVNADGKRIAGHTGKVSTAFGPFGILESTAANPGYGVAPLRDKSLEEQVRFSSDYLAARSKQAGGLPAGLAGYGEGAPYAQSVLGRLGKGNNPSAQAVQAAPVQQAEVPQAVLAGGGYPDVVEAPVPVRQYIPDEPMWQQFKQALPEEPLQAMDFNFGGPTQSMGALPTRVPARKRSTVAAASGFGKYDLWKGFT